MSERPKDSLVAGDANDPKCLGFYSVKPRKVGGRRQEGQEREGQNSGDRDIRRSVEGSGMGRGTRGIQDGHYRDFQEGRQEI